MSHRDPECTFNVGVDQARYQLDLVYRAHVDTVVLTGRKAKDLLQEEWYDPERKLIVASFPDRPLVWRGEVRNWLFMNLALDPSFWDDFRIPEDERAVLARMCDEPILRDSAMFIAHEVPASLSARLDAVEVTGEVPLDLTRAAPCDAAIGKAERVGNAAASLVALVLGALVAPAVSVAEAAAVFDPIIMAAFVPRRPVQSGDPTAFLTLVSWKMPLAALRPWRP